MGSSYSTTEVHSLDCEKKKHAKLLKIDLKDLYGTEFAKDIPYPWWMAL